jgi:hypothetical protein
MEELPYQVFLPHQIKIGIITQFFPGLDGSEHGGFGSKITPHNVQPNFHDDPVSFLNRYFFLDGQFALIISAFGTNPVILNTGSAI